MFYFFNINSRGNKIIRNSSTAAHLCWTNDKLTGRPKCVVQELWAWSTDYLIDQQYKIDNRNFGNRPTPLVNTSAHSGFRVVMLFALQSITIQAFTQKWTFYHAWLSLSRKFFLLIHRCTFIVINGIDCLKKRTEIPNSNYSHIWVGVLLMAILEGPDYLMRHWWDLGHCPDLSELPDE